MVMMVVVAMVMAVGGNNDGGDSGGGRWCNTISFLFIPLMGSDVGTKQSQQMHTYAR